MTLLWLCEMSLSGAAAPRTDGLPALTLREAPRRRHEWRVAAPSIRTSGALAKPTALLTCKMYEAYIQLRYDRNCILASILLPFGLSGLPEGFGTHTGIPHFGKAAALFRLSNGGGTVLNLLVYGLIGRGEYNRKWKKTKRF